MRGSRSVAGDRKQLIIQAAEGFCNVIIHIKILHSLTNEIRVSALASVTFVGPMESRG